MAPRRMALAALLAVALLGGALTPAVQARPAAMADGPRGGAVGASRPADTTGIPRLTDRRGRTLTLRGWNVEDKTHHGAEALSAITERHFSDLRARGFNVARLLVLWDDLEPRRGHYSEGYLRKIQRILGWAHKHRIQVVLDAHQDVFGPAFGHRGIPRWATRTDGLPFTPHPDDWFAEYFEPAVQRAFTHLYEDADLRTAQARVWRLLAARFGGHPALLGYDLINEPMGELRPGEDLASAARRIEATQLTPLYNRLADAIRTRDRSAWLFVEPTPIVGEGVPTGLGRVDDERVVYAPHFYNTAMEAGADYDPSAGWIEAYERAVTAYPREHSLPVVVGEWGPLNSGLPHMRRFYDDALASLNRYSSGWAGYVWCYGGGYCALDPEGRFRTNKERTATPYAPAVAGAVREDAHDPATGTYRLAYRAARRPGTTELSLPPSPTGWRVEVTGRGAHTSTDGVPAGRAGHVKVWAARHAEVAVRVTPGPGGTRS
ncbi:Cellulase (glycosyl hydrolase family 5) [Streptomyces sp. YIM 121038]|uniref:glycoside hydrolase family 5 protein n=1 Tax=Streptomyces sp. YIM 121038 TaxID=2136401 RepID=UPI0011109ED9|nr:cellulase family glycosylhydrolase [Streptomyces sp. YIM 121038]QCX81791.1 Cellulase (glycosyl hydrolase family 5) [Streptomyces sp. YIM 121038]